MDQVPVFGTAVIVLRGYQGGTAFLFQQKDEGHPNPNHRGKYTFFGGSHPEHRVPREALRVRLEEQFGNYLLAKTLSWRDLAQVTPVQDRRLPHERGEQLHTVYRVELDRPIFEAWKSFLISPKEGSAVIMSQAKAKAALLQPHLWIEGVPALLQEALPDLFPPDEAGAVEQGESASS